MVRVNVASLKAELSRYLDAAQKGEEIIITSHGEEKAKLVPLEQEPIKKGDWYDLLQTRAKVPGPKSLKQSSGELIRQMRDEE